MTLPATKHPELPDLPSVSTATRLAAGSSLLCEDEAARRRLLDMEDHMRSPRVLVFALLGLNLVVLSPWLGPWPLVPFAAALLGFGIAERRVPKSPRPEYWFMAALMFAELMFGLAVVVAHEPRRVFIAWLVIPAATLAARFGRRGVAVGVAWTALVMAATTVVVNGEPIWNAPQRLAAPLTLLACVVILTMGLMRSDVEHRAAAAIDPLTGVFNRDALARRAAELIEQARVMHSPVAVLMGDLDHFKEVNDEHGHHVGDAALREVAATMRATLRTFEHVYRYGGEEFVVLMPGANLEGAAAGAERLREAVSEARPAGIPVTISFGVSVSDSGDAGVDALLRAADTALYRAKAEGRDCVRLA